MFLSFYLYIEQVIFWNTSEDINRKHQIPSLIWNGCQNGHVILSTLSCIMRQYTSIMVPLTSILNLHISKAYMYYSVLQQLRSCAWFQKLTTS